LVGEGLRAQLRAGFNVLVHCKGGLGRAGTIAARLMIELGTSPKNAVAAVRNARPGAIKTSAQLAYVMGLKAAPEISPRQPQKPSQTAPQGRCWALPSGMP